MNKLILICLGIFVFATSHVALAETALGQKAKQTGLNTASQNQMLTQKLGTEVMVKSPRLLVLSYDFAKYGASSGDFSFREKGTGNLAKIPKCHILSALSGGHVTISTPRTVTVAGGTGNIDIIAGSRTIVDNFNGGTQFPALTTNLAVGVAISQDLTTCSTDTTVKGNVSSGTLSAGVMDVILEVTPYNQTP